MKRARIACPVLARTALSHLRSLFGKVIAELPRMQQSGLTLTGMAEQHSLLKACR